jgi:acyl-CoA thioesterase
MAAAKPPRFTRHVGLHIEKAEAGEARCTLELQDFHINSTGVVHGGVHFTLADTAMGAALYSTLEEGQICATIEIKIGYFKPVFEGNLVCTAAIVNKGKSVASLEASIHNGDVLVSKASGTFSIFRRKTDAKLAGPPVTG